MLQNGGLPKIINSDPQVVDHNDAALKRALFHSSDNVFRKISDIFYGEHQETEIVKGARKMYGLIGDMYSGASEIVHAVSMQQNVAVLDMTKITKQALNGLTIQQIVDYILDTPKPSAILMNLSSDELRMTKVLKRIAAKEISSHSRLFVFCMTRDESNLHAVHPTLPRIHFPGTVDDRIAMLLYQVPSKFADTENLRFVAKSLRDYKVFHPNIKRLMSTECTLVEYCRNLHYQIVKRNGDIVDEPLDEYPSFEVPWRQSFSEQLRRSLVPSPETTSLEIHRVLPVGVCASEALQCFQSALPSNLKSPYVMMADSHAVNDKCGSIAIVQEAQHFVININCNVDPGVMPEVLNELRLGYRSVVKELSQTNAKLEEMNRKFAAGMDVLKDLVKAGSGDRKRTRKDDTKLTNTICKKKTCMNPVTERFVNGDFKKQCSSCNSF